MNYRLQSKPKRRVRPAWIAAALLTLLFILLVTGIMPKGWLMKAAFSGARPLWYAEGFAQNQIGGVLAAIASKQRLVSENEDLKEQLAEHEAEAIRLSVLEDENQSLKSLLNRSTSEKRVLAIVLSRPPHTPYDTLVIDAATRDPIRVGDRVVAAGDVAIGTIAEIAYSSAKVRLFSSADEHFDALVGSSTSVVAAFGKGGGNFTAEVPRGIAVAVGDPVILPSINPKIFGVVQDVMMKPTDSFQTVLFRSPVNMSELKWVEVVSSVQ